MINYTIEGFEVFGTELHATSAMTRQNRQALDWLFPKLGCKFGEQCCTYIPGKTVMNGTFSVAMNRLKKFQAEITENAGDAHEWQGL